MIDFYGLKTCDTCKRARKSLDDSGVVYAFHDLRDEGVSKKKIKAWAEQAGWETLLNRNSATWRDLPHSEKIQVTKEKAVDLMAEHPTLMKRPIIERDGTAVYVGWSKEVEGKLKKK